LSCDALRAALSRSQPPIETGSCRFGGLDRGDGEGGVVEKLCVPPSEPQQRLGSSYRGSRGCPSAVFWRMGIREGGKRTPTLCPFQPPTGGDNLPSNGKASKTHQNASIFSERANAQASKIFQSSIELTASKRF